MLRKWCETTSCDGIYDLYESRNHNAQFTFWSIIMISMFVASVWFTFRTIVTYNETPTATNVATIPSATLDIPDVLICYNGGLNASAMKDANLTDNLIVTFHEGFAAANIYVKDGLRSAQQELYDYMQVTNYGIKDIVRKFSFDCKDIVLKFVNPKDKMSYANEKCDTAETITTPTGNCYAYSKNNGFQSYPGKAGGLMITIKSPNNSFSTLYPKEASAIDLDGDFSLTFEKNLGNEQTKRSTSVPINSKTQITLRPNLYKRTSKKVQCETQNFSSTNVCFNHCYIQNNVDTCGCMPLDYWYGNNDKDDTPACNPLNITFCWGPPQNTARCQANCKPMCIEWIYETTMSYGPMLIEEANSSKVFVFYNTMQYNEIEVVDAFTLDMAIANVGGQSGLWLGCSIITIIQAFYFIILGCMNSIKRKLGQSRKSQIFIASKDHKSSVTNF